MGSVTIGLFVWTLRDISFGSSPMEGTIMMLSMTSRKQTTEDSSSQVVPILAQMAAKVSHNSHQKFGSSGWIRRAIKYGNASLEGTVRFAASTLSAKPAMEDSSSVDTWPASALTTET